MHDMTGTVERRVTRIVVVTYVAVLQPTVGEVWQRLAHALGGFHACAATDELRGRQLGRVLLLVELGEVGDDVLVGGLQVLEHALHRRLARVDRLRRLRRLQLLLAVHVGVEARSPCASPDPPPRL